MELPTRKQWDKASPFEKGYMSYTFSSWPGSTIPSERKNPYPSGTIKHKRFAQGVHAAVIAAQDGEE